ncbi:MULTISPECIES: DUF262 domain-containing protein [Rhodopseudomonas]|uniref:DUF262 domain-containing protein n=1 Tax=Rhodopseudomonas TaxID=1073 RepID=UPI0009BB5706|nr:MULTISPECIES: DUF262 domain-containing protein [Rhodopseudomonas]MDF3811793.1 DUF262 domain-containing protein [Rhodopseudomonas sp. BAL398]WOK20263.1 DUF262 domain-containing protein [Rhodopseudomonas sp. BAL398]
MSYSATTVSRIVDRINRSYFLPAIQRPYVWEPSQIIALFDSLMKGYPISSFLFWEVKPENRENWDIYQFVEHFRYGQVHNEPAETDGRDVTLVLDGQQRLTSLFIGLRGTYTVKIKNKRWDNPDAWVRQRLYLNLLQDPNADDEIVGELGIGYGFKFSADDLTTKPNQLWFKVGKMLDFDSEDEFYRFQDKLLESLPGDITIAQQRTARRNLEQLYRVIWKDEVVSFYTEKNQSYDRVLDIFIRANDGGTKLSKSDLLLSMITSKWEGISAREEIYGFVENLNESSLRKNDIDKDFVMRACLVLSDLEHVYKISNFTNKNLALIQANWSHIRTSIEDTFRLVNRFGIDRDTLTSANALLPISYYLFKVRRGSLDGSTSFEAKNSQRVHRWLLGCLINNVFGGNSDQTIGVSRAIIRESLENSEDFPYFELIDGLKKRRGRVVNFDDQNLDALLEIRYGHRTAFLALSLLYDKQAWGTANYHIDHIIPKSLASRRSLMAANISEDRILKILNFVDSLGNLQLLLGRENLEKSNTDFSDWINTRDADFLKEHLIPNDPSLWHVSRLPEFVAHRERLIKQYLTPGLRALGEGMEATAAMGK